MPRQVVPRTRPPIDTVVINGLAGSTIDGRLETDSARCVGGIPDDCRVDLPARFVEQRGGDCPVVVPYNTPFQPPIVVDRSGCIDVFQGCFGDSPVEFESNDVRVGCNEERIEIATRSEFVLDTEQELRVFVCRNARTEGHHFALLEVVV